MQADKKPYTGKPRGFSVMTPERRAEIARLGGSSVPAAKRSFSQNRALAKSAGRKGGLKRSDLLA
jgi:general stress protein YciG